jgi:hypothetical protein
MKLNIKKTNNSDNNYYYYITFSNEKIESTLSYEQIECSGNDKREIIAVHLRLLTPELKNSLLKLAREFPQIQMNNDSTTINLSNLRADNKTQCTVNFDIDGNNEIIGIEIF